MNNFFKSVEIYDEYGELDYDVAEKADNIARKVNLYITSDRELSEVFVDKDDQVVAAKWESWDGENYEFDVVVDPASQGKGIGKSIILDSLEIPDDYIDENEEATMDLHVVSPVVKDILLDNGFSVRQTLGQNDWVIGKDDQSEPTLDDAGRVERASTMGFSLDENWFHGTDKDVDSFVVGGVGRHGNVFGDGVYITKHPDLASMWAGEGEGANVMPLVIRGDMFDASDDSVIPKNVAQTLSDYANSELDSGDRARIALDAGVSKHEVYFDKVGEADEFFDAQMKNWEYFSGFDRTMPEFIEKEDGRVGVSYIPLNDDVDFSDLRASDVFFAIQRAGGAVVTNALTEAGYDGVHISDTQSVVFDPANVKSKFSYFDVNNPDSALLSDRPVSTTDEPTRKDVADVIKTVIQAIDMIERSDYVDEVEGNRITEAVRQIDKVAHLGPLIANDIQNGLSEAVETSSSRVIDTLKDDLAEFKGVANSYFNAQIIVNEKTLEMN